MTNNMWGKKTEKQHDWRKISCSLWFLNIFTTKIINYHSMRRTCSVVLGISRPGGMGVSSQQRQLLLQFEWSLETPFRGPWKRQQFLLCLVKIVPCLFMTNIYTKSSGDLAEERNFPYFEQNLKS